MTRRGKIARLPRHIRDELNQRLDNGEPGVALIDWLNNIPEVKDVLETHFDSQPVSASNLTEWKQGGFHDWQAHQEARVYVQDSNCDAAELAKPLAATLLDQYAVALSRSNADEAEDPRDRARRLGKSICEVVRVLRCDQGRQHVEIRRERTRQHSEIQRERLALGREWLELEKSKIENQKSKPQAAKPQKSETPDLDSMSREEKSAYIKKIIYG